jgi:methyl-accepting chemotaxis protein
MSSRRFWVLLLTSLTLVTVVIGWGVNTYLIDKRIEIAGERLALLGTLRRDALERYLDTAEAELGFWGANEFLLEQQAWLVASWHEGVAAGRDPAAYLRQTYIEGNSSPHGPGQTENAAIYAELHAQLHPMAKRFVTERGYHDFFLISPSGDIHYSVGKEDDFTTNLMTGPYKDTGLGDVFRQVIAAPESNEVRVSDLQAYAPSGGMPAMFLARAMYSGDGEFIGVIALQVPTEKIHSIMHFDKGMGETGETYLVGQDYLMRSDSRFSQESTVLKRRVESATAQRALRGEYGVEFTTDYRGVEVLSAYSSLPIGETNWAVMAEIDKAEILERVTSERPVIAGFMLFFYSLGIWSAWFIQRSEPAGTGGELLADLDVDSAADFLNG